MKAPIGAGRRHIAKTKNRDKKRLSGQKRYLTGTNLKNMKKLIPGVKGVWAKPRMKVPQASGLNLVRVGLITEESYLSTVEKA